MWIRVFFGGAAQKNRAKSTKPGIGMWVKSACLIETKRLLFRVCKTALNPWFRWPITKNWNRKFRP